MRTLAVLVTLALLMPVAANAQEDRLTSAINGLSSKTEGVRMDSIRTLSELAPIAKPAVPALIATLGSGDIAFEHEAMIVLGRIGPAAEAAVPSLTKILSGDSMILKHSALHALRMIGPKASSANAKLMELADSRQSFIAIPAAWALASINSDNAEIQKAMIAKLVRGLADPTEEIAIDAIYGLSEIGQPAVASISKAIGQPKPELCVRGCDALAGMQSDAREAVPALLTCLAHSEPTVQWHAARALGEVGSTKRDGEVVQALAGLLSSKDLASRGAAAQSLGELGAASEPAVGALAMLLSDPDSRIRATAARSLGQIGEGATKAVPALIKALDDTEGIVTITAAEALGGIGPAAIPSLLPKLDDPNLKVLMLNVVSAMGPGAADATEKLVSMLDDKELDVRIETAVALAGIGPAAKKAAPALVKRLTDPRYTPRAAMAYALAKIGEKDAIPALKQTVQSDDERLKLASAWALVTLDPTNPGFAVAAVPALTAALDNEKSMVRQEAAEALAQIGAPAKSAVMPLMKLYAKDDNPDVRSTALYAIIEIDPTNENLGGIANQALSDQHPATRITAAYALGRMGADAKELAPNLKRMLRSNNRVEKVVAAWALLNVAPSKANVALAGPLCLGGLTSDDPEVRAELCTTIGRHLDQIQGAKTALQKVAESDESETVRAAAKAALEG